MTTVINIRAAPRGWEKNPKYAYIGRAGHGFDGYFGNPIPLKNETQREIVLEQYREYFNEQLEHDVAFRTEIMKLKDKILVCFCKPKLCHGDVIAEFLNQCE